MINMSDGLRKFIFKGKSLEELQKLSIEQFAELIPSRERRSIKRGFSPSEKKLIEKVKKVKEGKFVKTQLRDMVVLPSFVGKRIGIHSGKEYKAVDIQPEMVGHRLGEFSQTRATGKHSGPGIGATSSSKSVGQK
ncbi:30S ribosomal protein S19 [archaeon]|nr:30S ribosomal protein S19 [archaeon]